MWLHVIGSQRTRRIYRLITENIEIDHSSVQREYFAFVFLLDKVYVIKHLYHGYPCYITFISHKNDVIIIIIVKLHSLAARSSIQTFDNDYDVIFMTSKCYIAW